MFCQTLGSNPRPSEYQADAHSFELLPVPGNNENRGSEMPRMGGGDAGINIDLKGQKVSFI